MNKVLYCLVLLCILAISSAVEADSPYLPASQVGTINISALTEDSGVAASRTNANILYVHNDSGHSAQIFAISTSASLRQTFNLQITTDPNTFDPEDIAVGPGPTAGTNYLYLGDIGDNNSNRSTISVYRMPEPTVTSGTTMLTGIDKITLAYPDGAHNAETLMIDPSNGDIYVVTKASPLGGVYRASFPQSLSGTVALTHLSNVQIPFATAGDIAADGSKMIIRNKTDTAYEWAISPGETIADAFQTGYTTSFALHAETQGEGIGYSFTGDSNGAGFYTTSEGTNQPLYFYALAPEPGSLSVLAAGTCLTLCRRRRTAVKFIEFKRDVKTIRALAWSDDL